MIRRKRSALRSTREKKEERGEEGREERERRNEPFRPPPPSSQVESSPSYSPSQPLLDSSRDPPPETRFLQVQRRSLLSPSSSRCASDARDDFGRKKIDLVLELGESLLRVLNIQVLQNRREVWVSYRIIREIERKRRDRIDSPFQTM